MQVNRKLQTKNGYMEIITGCMFAGKTEEFIRRIIRFQYAGYKVQVFKPTIDNRHKSNNVVSHSLVAVQCQAVANKAEMALKLKHDTEIIGIEEIQFFDMDIVDYLNNLVNEGKIVIANGLDKDFRAEPFSNTLALMAKAEKIIKLNAICMVCGATADRTQRIINGSPAKWDDPTILIGASESYEARCRYHHIINKKK